MHQNFYVMYKLPNLLMFLILFYKLIISWYVSLNLFSLQNSISDMFVYVMLMNLTTNWNVKWQMDQFF